MKLSADFLRGNLRLLLGRESEFQGSNLLGLTLNRNIKGLVLDIFPGGGWISIEGQRLKAFSESATLLAGERLTLVAQLGKKGVELHILERELKGKGDFPHKLESIEMGVQELSEKIIGSSANDVSLETSLFKVLKSYYPFLEWARELPYFRWEFSGGNAEGTYDPQKEFKKFLFRIQTKNTGRTTVLFLWKENSGEDLQINATFDNLKIYLHACQNKEKFKKVLNELSVSIQGYNLAYKPSLARKEWNV
ncbi:hypothetical protein [Leptospira mayottensis]|nr:hypothetical protein [Leptospira mayottensis]AXR62478.1 hypothetical protein DQM68_13345 [Leptospira mayottensis]AXR66192.1 hypothetical protein DQM28_14340 [Leptospira mayottensis]AXR69866.1 hypothetical protein DPV73_14765 [Leptospira mayottensis]AZQ03769.1 hypothetical protein LEP1GSC190_08365 [Leptospira mayottensis 200901116]TGN13539.1 hypothetical protein EHR03_04970 [Leptospira mayottensis]